MRLGLLLTILSAGPAMSAADISLPDPLDLSHCRPTWPGALLWESGVGADLSARTAAPLVGGMVSCLVLTLLVLPAAYALLRHAQFRHRWQDLSG
jgi:hypothetical protein